LQIESAEPPVQIADEILLRGAREGVHECFIEAEPAAGSLPVLGNDRRTRQHQIECRLAVDLEREQPLELLGGRGRQVVRIVDEHDDSPVLRMPLLKKNREQIALLDLG
jgi:hypothetical protein